MTSVIDTTTERVGEPSMDDIESRIAETAERLFTDAIGMIEQLNVYVGVRLGLYDVLSRATAPLTAGALATAAGIDERYAREWLEYQAVAGLLDCPDRAAEADERSYALPAGFEAIFVDPDSEVSMAPLALALGGVSGVLPELVAAFRSGAGVPYSHYGADFRDGQAGFNRPGFVNHLAHDWLAAGLPDLYARLVAGEAVHIADVACGAGWSTIALAQAFPAAVIEGYDVDDASIADARRNAAEAGVGDRVQFEVLDAADLPAGAYDLVTVFEALHDMSQPVPVLRSIREAVAAHGTVLVMDERTADSFAESDGPLDAFLHGVSVLHCLPVGLADQPSVGTGTVLRSETVRAFATDAGFSAASVLPIEHEMFRFYELR